MRLRRGPLLIIEGVAAQGGRVVTILEAGAAGADQEVAVTNEKWVSGELRVLILRKLLDTRYGNTMDCTIKDMPNSDQ